MKSTTTFLLIRHAAHALGPRTLAGRLPDVHLSSEGKSQAEQLATRLAHLPIAAIYSSPADRTRETAQPLATRLGLSTQISEAIHEVDFGAWGGKSLDELKAVPEWNHWNRFRSGSSTPTGETMLQIQSRAVEEMQRICKVRQGQCVAMFSHGDVIRAAVAYWLGVPLDMFTRIEISLASVSVVAVGEFGPWVLCVNSTGRVEMPY